MVDPQSVVQHLLQGVREGRVPDVMQERGGLHLVPLLLPEGQGIGHLARDVEGAQRVLEAGVVRPGEDQVSQPELVDPMQPLHLGAAQQPQENTLDAQAAMHAIVNDLELWHQTKICAIL